MPEPRADETREDWIARCMGDAEQRDSFPDADQRAAVCHARWEEKDRKEQSRTLPPMPIQLRTTPVLARPGRVDREAGRAGIIYGYTAAETGVFKDRRGEFNREGLRQAAALMNAQPRGVKSHFAHPTLSADGLGRLLGRAKNARVEGDQLKADLHLLKSSRSTPDGDLGGYIMDLAEEDSAAFGSSLVLVPVDEQGEMLDPEGNGREPQLWFPKEILGSDVVDEGDAVHTGFLGVPADLRAAILAGQFPDHAVRQATAMLDSVFAGQTCSTIKARVLAWLERYLTLRFPVTTPQLDARRGRLERMAAAMKRRN